MSTVSRRERDGSSTVIDPDAFLAGIERLGDTPAPPFSDDAMAVLGALSARLLGSSQARAAPQLTALGYWLRPAALKRLKESASLLPNSAVRVARGVAYQLPPRNVDTLFVYSWALSFLLGNANVTRLPEAGDPVSDWLVSQILACLWQGGQAERQVFCGFDHRGDIGAGLSRLSDLRVVWGGDRKVLAVSTQAMRPDGASVNFPDRTSIALIDGSAYEALDELARETLAGKLMNDIVWFDQMGCGSPRVLVWREPDSDAGYPEHDLLERVDRLAAADTRRVDAGVDMAKFVRANALVGGQEGARARRYSASLTSVSLTVAASWPSGAQGGGFIVQTRVTTLAGIEPLVRRELQTIATFGLSQPDKLSLAQRLGGRGGYRIVPIGEALQFDPIWDGMDLVGQFSRLVTVR